MEAKAQHYVPQVYLRNFAIKRRKGYFISCLDKTTQNKFNTNIKNIAHQNRYYEFITQKEKKISIETYFNDIENKLRFSLDAIIDKPNISVLMEHRTVFSKFISMQESRTPVFNDIQDDTIRLANKKINLESPFFPPLTENDKKEMQARFLLDTVDFFADVLSNMKWILITNQTNQPFWTSDNPVFRYNSRRSPLVGNLGLKSPGIELYVPLTPLLAILLCDPIMYKDMPSELSAYKPTVDFSNSGQVIYSRQYIYSHENDFPLAYTMLKENPALSNPYRPRITAM